MDLRKTPATGLHLKNALEGLNGGRGGKWGETNDSRHDIIILVSMVTANFNNSILA